MRIPVRQHSRSLQFNITPLIDIVFLLIIFFLVASHFVRNEASVELELPKARRTLTEQEQASRRLIVSVEVDGTLSVGQQSVSIAQIEAMIAEGREQHLSDFEVRIRGDRRIPYRQIEPVLMACARAGVGLVRFAVLPR